jgi:hypothetical protein
LEKSAFASSFRLDGLLHSDLGFANEVRTLAHAGWSLAGSSIGLEKELLKCHSN